MNLIATKKQNQDKKSKSTSIRVDQAAKKILLNCLARVNKKPYGQKVKISELIVELSNLITPEIIKKLQENSLTHGDKLELEYKQYVSRNGYISKDEFIGEVLKSYQSDINSVATDKTPDISIRTEK